MPKGTKEKTHKDKPYSKEGLRNALQCVRDGSTIAYASKTFNVPRTTLHNKLTGKYPEECPNGRPTILSKEQEKELVKWILGCADGWHPIGKEQVLDSVKLICEVYKIPNHFTAGRPGDVWFRNFLKRHPELSKRKPKSFSLERATVTAEDLTEWFQNCLGYFTEHNLLSISPDRVFNCDESAFFLTPEDGNVLSRRGSRVVPSLKNSGPKQCITVLFMMSATGELAPPMAVHKTDITPKIAIHNAEGWKMGTSPQSGWMDGPLFYAGLYFPKIVFQHSEESIINNQHDQATDNNPSNDPVFPGNQLSATSETQPIFDTLKQCYFWPGEIPKRRQKKRVKASNVKHQYIVSSEEMIAEQEEKLRQDLQKKKEIAERKLTRERNKKIRAEEKEIKLKEKHMVKEKAQMPIEAEKKKRGRKSAKKTEEKSKN
ncbi:uncharacterized protein LOC129804917 [Phlebotomus papatasi]|uniref:uncharacterized protein LOC129804917 n=1 Tax=Phlebotomus papatasi TaxID=29031 RepID=UPI0024838BE3|nr:uncharacterized protein LOC129804917 [Phlebotomus papatasi]